MDEMTNQRKENPDFYPASRKEFRFGFAVLVGGLFMMNSILSCGYNLGFAIGVIWVVLWSMGYLLSTGGKLTPYRAICLASSVAIAGSFLRNDDGLVKFFMVGLLLISSNLALCLTAEQNLRQPGQIGSLLDAPRAMFVFGWGRLAPALRGLGRFTASEKRKRSGSVLLGVMLAALVLAVLVPLLISADAAFEGLMSYLPKIDIQTGDLPGTVLLGGWMGVTLYTQAVALRYAPKNEAIPKQHSGVLSRLTIQIVLMAVVFVYGAYLVSQLAYLVGGFAGLLPEGYTPAEYARRGFFEMFLLCAINLTLILLAVRLERREDGSSGLIKLLSLCIGVFSLFLVVSASARMGLYIQRFGLTKLRLLTELIMLWLGVTTGAVCLWRYLPKLPYMKIVLATALLLGATVSWADVDAQIAKYNVNAYLSGQLSQVDVRYLENLSAGAIPYMAELLEAEDEALAQRVSQTLAAQAYYNYHVLKRSDGWEMDSQGSAIGDIVVNEAYQTDLRGWNWSYAQARKVLLELAKAGKLDCTQMYP